MFHSACVSSFGFVPVCPLLKLFPLLLLLLPKLFCDELEVGAGVLLDEVTCDCDWLAGIALLLLLGLFVVVAVTGFVDGEDCWDTILAHDLAEEAAAA